MVFFQRSAPCTLLTQLKKPTNMCISWVTFDFDHVGKVRVADFRGDRYDVEENVTGYCENIGCVVMLHAVPATLTPDVILVPDNATGAVRTIYVAAADPAEIAALTAANAAQVAEFIGSEPKVSDEDGHYKYFEWEARHDAAMERFAQAVFLKLAQHDHLTAALRPGVAE
jgi:hypothetical protein